MLAPLLLGTGMLLRSIKANAAAIIPRVGLLFVLLWACWFAHSAVQRTLLFMQTQGRLDRRTAAGLVTLAECVSLTLAGVVALTVAGVNLGGLLLPAAAGLALASKDVAQNLAAGGFLFVAAPFRIGDRVAVPCAAGAPAAAAAPMQQQQQLGGGGSSAPAAVESGLAGAGTGAGAAGGGGGWFEGVCEGVSLRYTVLRCGRRRVSGGAEEGVL